MKNDDFGDRMKMYEQAEAGRRLMPLVPVVVRLDGKGFHNWTKDLDRPYDKRLSDLMVAVTKILVDKTAARIGYTQSDEISLVLYSETLDSQIFFDGKVQKLTSVLASMVTGYFNRLCDDYFIPKMEGGWQPTGLEKMPLAFFDCRAWIVPNKTEAANAILWREQDASKNSISMAARHYFSHKELHGKSGPEMQEMMFSKHGVNWNDYPAFFKRGTFVSRRKVLRELTAEELEKIPEKQRSALGHKVERTEVRAIDNMPRFSQVLNREGFIFHGVDPLILDNNSAGSPLTAP